MSFAPTSEHPAANAALGLAGIEGLASRSDVLAQVIALSPTAIAVLDEPSHRHVLANDAYAALARCEGPLVGQTVADVWPELGAGVVGLLDRVVTTGEPLVAADRPFDVVRDGGPERLWLSFTLLPMGGAAGRVERVLVMATEVTEHVRALEAARDLAIRLETERQRLVRSNELTSALSGARTRADVARTVTEKGLPALGADAGVVALAAPGHPDQVELVEQLGYPPALIESWRTFPLALHAPVSDAFRTGEPVWVASPAEAQARFPEWAPAVATGRDRAWAALPLVVEGRTIGALGLTWFAERGFDDDERAFLAYLAARCAQALDRAEALEVAQRRTREIEAVHARLGAFAASDVVGVLFGDVDGAISACNDEFARIVGRSREELTSGRVRWDEITPPEDLPLDARAIEEARRAGRCRPYEKRYVRPDGSRVPVEIGYVLLEPDRREAVAFVLDISARRAAEEAIRAGEERLRETLRYAAAGTWEWDFGDGFHWSDENYALFGVEFGTPFLPSSWPTRVEEEDLPKIEAAVRAARDGEAGEYRQEFRVHHPIRGLRWVLGVGRVERDADGRALRLRGLNLDITERKLAEEEVRASDRRKTEFLGVLSHELRNPLAPIRNGIRVLERVPPDSEPGRRAREIIQRQTDHLARLVDDLLDVTRIAHGKIELVRTRADARDVARRACDDVRAGYEQRDVRLEYSEAAEPAWVEADVARLAQMVGNVLHNALKFTPPGGTVRLHVAKAAGAVEIAVTDSGMGIASEDLERIFDRFVQAERTRERVHGGMGIGLSLVRDLAALHGGAVRATSAGPGQGARFVIQLPLAAGGAAAVAARPAAEGRRRRSVLLVEDNEDAAATLADVLALSGDEVTVVHTGRAGIEAVAARRPDVLICDVGLPDVSGHEVIRAVRAANREAPPFAIALTGYAQPHDREAALEAGFDAHLAKPPVLDELEALICRASREDGATRG